MENIILRSFFYEKLFFFKYLLDSTNNMISKVTITYFLLVIFLINLVQTKFTDVPRKF